MNATGRRHRLGSAEYGAALTSRNLWLLIAGLEVLMTLLSPLPGDTRRPALNIAAGVLSSLALLGVVWVGNRFVLQRLDGRFTVAGAVPVILVAALTRGVVLQTLLVAWDISQPGVAGFRHRLVSSVLVVAIGAFVGAALKVAVDGHRRRLEELEAERVRLQSILDAASADLRSGQDEAADTIAARLSEQLAGLRGTTPQFAAASLDTMCAGVVRPLSHALADALPTWTPQTSGRPRLDWSRVWGTMASPASIDPISPAVVLLVTVLATGPLMGWPAALLLHGVAAALVWAGLTFLRAQGAGVAAGRSTATRLMVTTVLLVVACVPAGIATWLLAPEPVRAVDIAYVLLMTPLVALLFSFLRATRQQQPELEQQAAELVDQTRWWLTRTQLVQWWQAGTIARALHGPVQTTLHVTVQQLRSAAASGAVDDDTIDALLADTRRSLVASVSATATPAALDAGLESLATMWNPLVAVDWSAAAAARALSDADPIGTDIALDIIGEAVSNAIRHGGARTISITVAIESVGARSSPAAAAAVTVEITDDGGGWSREVVDRAPGLGTRQLEQCALHWEYDASAADGPNALRLALPFTPGAGAARAT